MAFMDKCAQKNSALKKLVRAAIRAWSITQAARPVNAPQTTTAGSGVCWWESVFKVDYDKVASVFDDPRITTATIKMALTNKK
jgi:hypothetical protein